MNCRTVRNDIHRWMDSPGQLMPDSIRDHIRDCAECHAFIKQWNAIEVGLVSVRAQGPAISPGFAAALDVRLAGVRQGSPIAAWFRRLVPPRQARLALVGSSAALVLWIVYLVGTVLVATLTGHGPSSLAANGDIRHTEPAPPIPAQIQLTPPR